MSRIVIATIGSLGDLHPMIAIALELQQRGHQVIFATLKDYKDKVESLGLTFHSLRPDHISPDDPDMMAMMMDLKTGTEKVVRDYLFGHIHQTYEDLMAAARGADLLVSAELIYASPVVAEVLKLPWMTCILSPISLFSAYDPPVFPTLMHLAQLRNLGPWVNQGIIQYVKWMTRSWGAPLHKLRQDLGLPPTGNPMVDAKFSPHANLALFSTAFAPAQPDWPKTLLPTGFAWYDGSHCDRGLAPELQQFLDAGDPPIVFTLGSAAVFTPGTFYEESIKAAEQLNQRAVLLVGRNASDLSLPKNMIAVDYVPFSQLFPHACVIVHQGGIGTTGQGLRSGRPTLVVPYSHDQPDNALRLERLGTSRMIPRDRYTADRAAQVLEELLKRPSYAATAQAIARQIQAEQGTKTACDAIEKQLHPLPV